MKSLQYFTKTAISPLVAGTALGPLVGILASRLKLGPELFIGGGLGAGTGLLYGLASTPRYIGFSEEDERKAKIRHLLYNTLLGASIGGAGGVGLGALRHILSKSNK